MLKGKTIVLGVTGSIAAYKMANVASMLVKRGCEVHVVMTKNATNFINPIAFESLTNTKCLVETFDRNFQFHVAHVSLTDKADAMLIAPASANIIGKIANGIADDMLSTTVMACNKPVIISPAMNTKMYNNPILQDNLDKLRRFGYEIVEPANGHLACGTSGAGKMPSEEVLVAHLERVIAKEKDLKGKKVLVRCDFNVPLQDGKITDENRLVAALPTIKKLIADGGKVILCSHLGKPKGEPKPELSLAPVAVRLSELLGQEVKFAADPEVVGPNAKAAVEAMKDGDVILLENTRYRAEETKNGDEFSKELASLCDVFVNDAFGTAHRAHCSNVGVTKYVDTAVVGYLMQKEIDFLGNAVNNPNRPFVAILGGAKVSSKISVINNLLDKVDTLIIGGGMSYTFSKAMGGHIGTSLCEDDYLQYALDMMKKAEEKGVKLLLPVDNRIW